MNKSAIQTFAAEARKRLIADTTYRAELLGITRDGIQSPDSPAPGIERFEYAPGLYHQISGAEIPQRERLVARIREAGFEQVIEETAYIWFNRLIAVRFMEVHDYLPVRVLSSETEGKAEPDIVSQALELDFSFSPDDKACILELQQGNKIDELFKMLFIKQCNILNESLPGMFQRTEDYTELLFPLSYTNPEGVIKRLLSDIPEEDFLEAVEIIGWLYQYYNTELNALVYDGKLKKDHISKELLPAATTMYTPDWAIHYMVENSLGRLWLEGHPNEGLKQNLKYYLDDIEQTPEVEEQLRKIKEGYSKLSPEDITFLDPCMGSGHILVYAFDVLMQIYESAGYQSRDAAKLILEKNLYGLDIDDRAGQLAYFAVMMKAREYNRRILSENIEPNLCSIQESNGISDDFLSEISGSDKELFRNLVLITHTFIDAKEYGSILNVPNGINFALIDSKLKELSHSSLYLFNDVFKRLCAVVKQAKILSKQYGVVVTNPPYFGSSRFSKKLGEYVNANYPLSKSDLSTVMYNHAVDSFVKPDGFVSFITTSSWFFLSSFEKLRQKILSEVTFDSIVDFGTELFDGKIGHNPIISWVNRNSRINKKITAIRLVDYCYSRRNEKVSEYYNSKNRHYQTQDNFAKIPGSPIAYWVSKQFIQTFETGKEIGNICPVKKGMDTSDNDRFLRYWTEITTEKFTLGGIPNNKKWIPYDKGGNYRKWYGNKEYVVNFENDGEELKHSKGNLRSQQLYFKTHLTWSALTAANTSFRYSDYHSIFDSAGSSLFPPENMIYYVLGLMNSKVFDSILDVINPTLNYGAGSVSKMPVIDSSKELERINHLVTANIHLSRLDWDSFETSWDFQTHPFITHKGTTLKESFENWQTFAAQQFAQLKANEEELNRIFIEIYGLQDELTPEVAEKDVTIRRADLVRDVRSFISYAVGCMMGRYSLDAPGLVFAGGEFDASKYVKFPADEDGIIPITDRDYFPDDIVGRFIEFLKVVFGAETLEENLEFVAEALGTKGRTAREIIRNYFLKGFYEDHVRIYQKRPIYWLFNSGKENGFKALIYLHRYDKDTAGRVRADYLHETQKKIEAAAERAEYFKANGTATEKSKATDELVTLHKQLEETKRYDEALATIALQRIELDLDDGVKVNYAKFQNVNMGGEGKMKKTVNLLGEIK